MTDKERLEEIKKENSFYLGFKTNSHAILTHSMPVGDINWLIEQAERVQELEVQNQGLHIMYDVRLAKFDKLEQQNKRYREALKFYADEYVWFDENRGTDYYPDYRCEAQDDGGEIARKALEEGE